MNFRDILMLATQQHDEAAGGGGGGGPIAFVDHAVGGYTGASTGATTGAIDTTTADFLVVGVTGYGASTWTVSDSEGNTWTAGTKYDATAQSPSIQLYYCTNPNTSATHTFSLAGASVYGRINAAAFSGVAQSSPLDTANSASGAGSSNTLSSGAVTPAADGALLISLLSVGGGNTFAYTGSPAFTSLDAHTVVGGQDYSTGFAYYIQSTAASIDSTWGWANGTGDAVASLTAFKDT